MVERRRGPPRRPLRASGHRRRRRPTGRPVGARDRRRVVLGRHRRSRRPRSGPVRHRRGRPDGHDRGAASGLPVGGGERRREPPAGGHRRHAADRRRRRRLDDGHGRGQWREGRRGRHRQRDRLEPPRPDRRAVDQRRRTLRQRRRRRRQRLRRRLLGLGLRQPRQQALGPGQQLPRHPRGRRHRRPGQREGRGRCRPARDADGSQRRAAQQLRHVDLALVGRSRGSLRRRQRRPHRQPVARHVARHRRGQRAGPRRRHRLRRPTRGDRRGLRRQQRRQPRLDRHLPGQLRSTEHGRGRLIGTDRRAVVVLQLLAVARRRVRTRRTDPVDHAARRIPVHVRHVTGRADGHWRPRARALERRDPRPVGGGATGPRRCGSRRGIEHLRCRRRPGQRRRRPRRGRCHLGQRRQRAPAEPVDHGARRHRAPRRRHLRRRHHRRVRRPLRSLRRAVPLGAGPGRRERAGAGRTPRLPGPTRRPDGHDRQYRIVAARRGRDPGRPPPDHAAGGPLRPGDRSGRERRPRAATRRSTGGVVRDRRRGGRRSGHLDVDEHQPSDHGASLDGITHDPEPGRRGHGRR